MSKKTISDYFSAKQNSSAAPVPNVSRDESENNPATSASEASKSSKCITSQPKSTGRKFQSSWKENHSWIHHDKQKDLVFCHSCVEAVEMKMPLPTSSREKDSYQTFVVNGFSNWKKAIERFDSHERSEFHKSAVKMVASATSAVSVDQHLNSQRKQEMADARSALLKIFSTLLYLVCISSFYNLKSI